jgi:hypothetical protein
MAHGGRQKGPISFLLRLGVEGRVLSAALGPPMQSSGAIVASYSHPGKHPHRRGHRYHHRCMAGRTWRWQGLPTMAAAGVVVFLTSSD